MLSITGKRQFDEERGPPLRWRAYFRDPRVWTARREWRTRVGIANLVLPEAARVRIRGLPHPHLLGQFFRHHLDRSIALECPLDLRARRVLDDHPVERLQVVLCIGLLKRVRRVRLVSEVLLAVKIIEIET